MISIEKNRKFMKAYLLSESYASSDQEKKLPQPPLEKAFNENSTLIELPSPKQINLSQNSIDFCINNRKSYRHFQDLALSLEQLSFLLHTTQGIKKFSSDMTYTKRTVPSAGARHPFETYLAISNVKTLNKGIYRYIASKHSLLFLHKIENHNEEIKNMTCGQVFCSKAALLFAWAAIPYRTEWRYGTFSHKAILLDAGHVCQNLYLSCEALELGTCGIGAYFQEKTDAFFKLDGKDEFVIYMAPVGVPAKK